MSIGPLWKLGLFILVMSILGSHSLFAATVTTNTVEGNQHAWAENIGWTNWRGQGSGEAMTLPPRIEPTFCSGFLWCENVGWINLGSGPTDGVSYTQVAGNTGVNVDIEGNLSGWAWGENIGWVRFDWTPTNSGSINQRPSIEIATGRFAGYVWGENIGWINLDGSAITPSAQLRVQPSVAELVDGITGVDALPLGSDINEDTTNADAADVVTLVDR